MFKPIERDYNRTIGRGTESGVGHVGDRASGAAIEPHRAGALVGRARELAALEHGLDEVAAGRGRVFLLAGEAGIGKSRLADEVARSARDRGALVVWGRCSEAGGAPAYWPWVQVLRSCLRDGEIESTTGIAAVAPVVEELAELRAGASAASEEAGAARFAQFDAVTTFLVAMARRRPMLIVLDDLQSADTPSLLLLRFVADQLADTQAMLVATFRREDAVAGSPLTEAVAELSRLPVTSRLDLAGLDGPDVAQVVRGVTGIRPAASVTAALVHETGGNPFFVSEISRLAAAEGRLDEVDPGYWARTIPQGVRQVVRLRVDRLSRECGRVLSLASVLGREFGVRQLSRLSGLGDDDLDEVLEEATGAGLLTDDPLAPGTHRFSHAVVRDALYDELPASHRARLHLEAAEILGPSGGDTASAAAAHHLFHAGPRAGVDRVVTSSRRAGDDSLSLLAYEEAARLYRMAITALAWADVPDLQTECALQLSLGDACSRAGDHDETRRSFLRAAELADLLDDPRSFARAALGYGGRFVWLRASADPLLLPLLERAMDAVGDDEPELRVRLMARMAGAKRDEPDRGPRDSLSAETVALARRTGDDGLLAYALTGRHAALLGPSHAPGDREPPDELLAVAARAGNAELRFEGLMHQLLLLVEQGDVRAATGVAGELDRIARDLRQPTHEWFAVATRANLALLAGHLDEADTLISRAMAIGLQSQNWDSQGFGEVQRFVLRREQGRLAEVREGVEAAIRTHPTRPLFTCMAAAMATDLGDPDGARTMLEELADDGFRAVPLNNDWSLSTYLLADTIHALHDTARAGQLWEVVRPAAGRCMETAEVSLGSMDHALGLLASTMGRWDDAVAHLEHALATNRRIGARPWAAHTRVALAEALSARGRAGDVDRAADELARARAVGEALGLHRLLGRVDARPAPATPSAVPAVAGADHERVAVFRREGDLWVVGLGGTPHRLRGSKGLEHIATLLASAGTPVHVLDLVARVGADARGPERRVVAELPTSGRGGGAQEVLDARARAEYRERIEALQAELEEADQWNDSGRAYQLREELDFLLAELTAASGLGGRSRSFTTDAERARVNVTRAIRAAISKVGECDPDLAWHLDRSVRTGTFCSYEPDREAPVTWQLA